MKFDLHRISTLLKSLANPQDAFPSIHVAGTNGKGSVCAMLESVLIQAGLRVGMYTSPHLETWNERFRLNGKPISDSHLSSLSAFLDHHIKSPYFRKLFSSSLDIFQIKKRSTRFYLTQFEYLTAIAFLLFKNKEVDVAVIEAGLGGRLDATNTLSHVLASVITNVDLEHTAWLGNTKEEIAFEKGGIIKVNTPIVTGAESEALEVLKSLSRDKNSPLILSNDSFQKSFPVPSTNLYGEHQKRNAALALNVLSVIQNSFPSINKAAIQRGFRNVNWPGRFEVFTHKRNGRERKIILDGAHNPSAVNVLVSALEKLKINKVDLLFGALKDKDISRMVLGLHPLVNQCIVVPLPSERSEDPFKISQMSEWRGKSRAFSSFEEGMDIVLSSENKFPVLVTGSLYLVGAVRSKLFRGKK